MKRTTLAVMIAVIALGSAAARAQDKTPTAPAAVPKPVVMPKIPEAPRPGPEVERLSYFVGAWTSAGHMKPSPLGDGGDTRGRDSCGWMPGKFFVGCMMQSESPMGRVQTEGIMGWDPDKKVYSWTSFDSMGRREPRPGTYENGVWTWSGESKLGDKMVKTRYIVSDTTPESYAFRWETSPDGKDWKSMMDGKVTKMQAATRPTRPGGGADARVTPKD